MGDMVDLLTIKEASLWASNYLNKEITTSNISYLIQYGKIKKHGENGNVAVNKYDLISYYKNNYLRESDWREKLGFEDVGSEMRDEIDNYFDRFNR